MTNHVESVHTQSESNQTIWDKLKKRSGTKKTLALVATGAMLAGSLAGCRADSARAEQKPSETTTSIEAETPEPTPEPTIEAPTPTEAVTEMPELPTFVGVDETYNEIMATEEAIANAGDDAHVEGAKAMQPYYQMLAINKFIEQNTGLDLYGTDKNGMVDYLNSMQSEDNEEARMGLGNRYFHSDDTMKKLYIFSEPDSRAEAIALTWAEDTFIDQDAFDDWVAYCNSERQGILEKNPESTANTIERLEAPKKVVGVTPFEVVGGPDHNYLIATVVYIRTAGKDSEQIIDEGYFDAYKIGVNQATGDLEFQGYILFDPIPDPTQFPEANELIGLPIGEARQMIGLESVR